MQRTTSVVSAILCFFVAGAAQLPPETMVERYLLRVDRLMESGDPKGALELMKKIRLLQMAFGVTLPDEFPLDHARTALSAGSIGEAIDAANGYLVQAGSEGRFYREALELLEEAERMEQLQTWFGTEKMCVGQPKGTSCWMEVTGKPDCHLWNHHLQPDEIVTWTGKCAEGKAYGEGTTRWVYHGGRKTLAATGSLKDGKVHGRWVLRWPDGKVEEGSYADWKRQGRWVIRNANGDVEQGPYLKGKKHGQWVVRRANGAVEHLTFEDDERLEISGRSQNQAGSPTDGVPRTDC